MALVAQLCQQLDERGQLGRARGAVLHHQARVAAQKAQSRERRQDPDVLLGFVASSGSSALGQTFQRLDTCSLDDQGGKRDRAQRLGVANALLARRSQDGIVEDGQTTDVLVGRDVEAAIGEDHGVVARVE
jgi:hypothetical protein